MDVVGQVAQEVVVVVVDQYMSPLLLAHHLELSPTREDMLVAVVALVLQ